MLSFLRQNEVGRRARINTPFGQRLITYADLTASGRYLHFVEAWFRNVRPFYANTHTSVSSTGRILTELREDARGVVRSSVGAGDEHVVIFCGAGATAAINKILGILGLSIPEPLQRRYNLAQYIPMEERPIVFVGPYEHHSNYLPWLESIADVVEIPAKDCGAVDLDVLAQKLVEHKDRALKLGSFSAASNVTGMKPGWVRLSLPYYASEADLEFVLKCVEFVASHGKNFVPSYSFDWTNGAWKHKTRDFGSTVPCELSASSLREAAHGFAAGAHETPMADAEIEIERKSYFVQAKAQLATLKAAAAVMEPNWNPGSGDTSVDRLVWFHYTDSTVLA